jgi:MFS family permease
MFSRQVKTGIFILEGLNALATTYYFYYAYFFMRETFGFSTLQNLLLAAGMGFIYMGSAIFCGRFARKHGYFLSLKIGFTILGSVIGLGSLLKTPTAHVAVLAAGNIGMCFTWPALQSIISDNERSSRLQSLTGFYNFVWAGASAFSYFIGGALIKKLGVQSMFLLPAGIHFFQLGMTFWLERRNHSESQPVVGEKEDGDVSRHAPETHRASPLSPETFLKMAWLANPFAYVAVNTVVAIMPTIADRLALTVKEAGFCCSVWFIVRAISFVVLRAWPVWHYRFAWLLTAYVGMVVGFAGILLASNLPGLIACQILFGVTLSLIYYSSLFYSMDVGTAKGDNAGFHEGMIGLGTGSGPAVGAAALYLFPQIPRASAFAVSGLLLWLKRQGRRGESANRNP